MSDAELKPLKLPVEAENLPLLDDLVVQAICLEHHHSILQFAMALIGSGWTPEQIAHVAARWPWAWLARAVGHGRQQRAQEPVAVALVEKLRAEPPPTGNVPPQPPVAG